MCVFDRQTNSADPLMLTGISFMRMTRYSSCGIGHGCNWTLVIISLMLHLEVILNLMSNVQTWNLTITMMMMIMQVPFQQLLIPLFLNVLEMQKKCNIKKFLL